MVKLCDSELKALMIIKHTNITAGESKKITTIPIHGRFYKLSELVTNSFYT